MFLSVDERDELRTTARSLLGRESSPAQVREVVRQAPGFDPELWRHMVQLGWTSIHVPERYGGAGCGYADLAVVIHELGHAITPSPFLASAVLASGALMLADNAPLAEEWLPPMTAGDALGAVALAGDSGSYDIARISTAWERSGDTVRLSGTSGFVLDAAGAAMLVVAARDADGTVAAIAVEPDQRGVQIERCRTVDETRQLSTVSFDAVVVGGSRMLCEPGAAAEALLDRVLAIGVVAAACDAAGVAEQALARAAAYASERVQFGKPIGSFQAVKHHCANMAIAVEASKAATRAAAEALDRDPAEWGATAAIAASYAGPACSEACALGLLVHGGIGFTWEQDSHLYLKRAKLDEVLFGTPSWHRRRLADAVFPTLIAS